MSFLVEEMSVTASRDDLVSNLSVKASERGFDAFGVASLPLVNEKQLGSDLQEYLADGRHGEMSWMRDTSDRRARPQAMWDDAKTAIVVAMNYGPIADPRPRAEQSDLANISVYALGDDYHELIKPRLKLLAGDLIAMAPSAKVKVFVDTAPLMEKPLAAAAGIGWQGKHSNLVSREFGSWLLLGSILTDLELDTVRDTPVESHCGSCRRCMEACPTGAIDRSYRIDARRCISYLTIELKGPIPRQFRRPLGNRIYGCDDCLAACPWNKYANVAREHKLAAREDLISPKLADFLELDDAAFRTRFSKNPVKRIGRDRFLRNVLYAVGNSQDRALLSKVMPLLFDASPLVRGAAVWCVSQLQDASAFAKSAAMARGERDGEVLLEWKEAIFEVGLRNRGKLE